MAATFGEMIDSLNTNPDITGLETVLLKINGEFTEIPPGYICSWRGSYEKGCLTPGNPREPMIVRELNKMLKESIDGRFFDGWKGGEYQFYRSTPIWYGPEGMYQEVALQGVEAHDGIIYVVIANEEY